MRTRLGHTLAGIAAGSFVAGADAEPPRYRAVLVEAGAPMDVGLAQRARDLSGGIVVGTMYPEVGSWRRAFVADDNGGSHVLAPLAGYDHTGASGVSERGMIVGQSTMVEGHEIVGRRATLWVGTLPVALATLGGPDSSATGINSRGRIVGYSQVADGALVACVWDGIEPRALALPAGADGSIGKAISDTGYAAGFAIFDGAARAARWLPDGTAQVLPLEGRHITATDAVGINDRGHALVLVVQDVPATSWGGVWRGDTFERVPLEEFWPEGINSDDAIVGVDLSGYETVYVDQDGVFPLGDLIDAGPMEIEYVDEIDDDGRIVGTARVGGRLRGVVLEPIGP